MSNEQKTARQQWIQIWYSWGDQEGPVKVPEGIDPWEYAKKLAIDEAETAFCDREEYGAIGISFYAEQRKIILFYPCDNSYCYYLVTDTEEYTVDNN